MNDMWTAIVGIDGRIRPMFALPASSLQGVRKGRAAVKAALDVVGLERVTDATQVWLADDSVSVTVVVIAPDKRAFSWSSARGFVRLMAD